MSVWEIALLGVALAMDACAVAMTNGMTHSKMPAWKALLIAVLFGFFQFLMPLIGYFITGIVAGAFMDTFEAISAWISFILLAFLGGKMLWECIREWIQESREKKNPTCNCGGDSATGAKTVEEERKEKELSIGTLLLQAIATSIDALAVGVTLQMAAISSGLALGVWGATGLIGVITLALALGAVYIGKLIGNRLADKASFFGGLVLIAIGIKLLIEGLL